MPARRSIRIGISGWRYAPWRGVFYPPGLVQRRELEFAAAQFDSIELNGSFYGLLRPEYYERWRAQTPRGFVFSVKAPRRITHMSRLREIDGPLGRFFGSGVLRLRDKLGPLLWQFPPNLHFDEARWSAFLAALPKDTDAARACARRAGADTAAVPRAGCATRWRSAIRASAMNASSHCCAAIASRWCSPTPPVAGRISRT
jgi:uncharacterized protein YecE (DUF72 family)